MEGRCVGGTRRRGGRQMEHVRRAILILVLIMSSTAALVSSADAAGKVGPKQYFTGVINGIDGNRTTPIRIEVRCAGSTRRGQTGHPVSGQTLAVHQLFPPSATAGSIGYTGQDSQVGVFFNAPPPAAGSRAKADAGTTTFVRYDKTKPLPTSLTLPCTGKGTVWFVPVAVVPPSQSESVSVKFVGRH
jgi:hypothetical protein